MHLFSVVNFVLRISASERIMHRDTQTMVVVDCRLSHGRTSLICEVEINLSRRIIVTGAAEMKAHNPPSPHLFSKEKETTHTSHK